MIAASGVRIGWPDLPERVRHAVEDILDSAVVSAASQAGGFSPGTADRVVTEDGGRVFVKAVGVALNERAVQLARGLAALAGGDTLTHCDIRADNLLVRPDGLPTVRAFQRAQGAALIPWLRTRFGH